MTNTARIHRKTGKSPRPSQSKTPAALIQSSELNHPTSLALFDHPSQTAFKKIPLMDAEVLTLTKTSISARLPLEEYIARLLRTHSTLATNGSAPKIPKGFVLINLATWQQKKLRKLANTSGIALRDALRWALTETQQRLENSALIKRKTGMTLCQWENLAGRNPHEN